MILGEIDVSTGYRAAGFMHELVQIVGQGNLGQATLSWRFEPPALPPSMRRGGAEQAIVD